jgi:hypothetical protein
LDRFLVELESTKVEHDSLEVLELRGEIRVVAAPSVNEDEGRVPFARFFIE